MGFRICCAALTTVFREGLIIIEESHPGVEIMEKLVKTYHNDWSKNIKMKKKFSKMWFNVPLLENYMNVMMHSRQIRLIFWRFVLV